MADILRVPHKIRRYPFVHAQPHRAMHHPQRKFPLAGVHAHPAWPHLGTYEFAATGPCAPPSPPPSLAAKQTDFQPDLAPPQGPVSFHWGARDKKIENPSAFLFSSSRLALSLDKIGCGSGRENKKTCGFSFLLLSPCAIFAT